MKVILNDDEYTLEEKRSIFYIYTGFLQLNDDEAIRLGNFTQEILLLFHRMESSVPSDKPFFTYAQQMEERRENGAVQFINHLEKHLQMKWSKWERQEGENVYVH